MNEHRGDLYQPSSISMEKWDACPYCGMDLPAADIDVHIEDCEDAPDDPD